MSDCDESAKTGNGEGAREGMWEETTDPAREREGVGVASRRAWDGPPVVFVTTDFIMVALADLLNELVPFSVVGCRRSRPIETASVRGFSEDPARVWRWGEHRAPCAIAERTDRTRRCHEVGSRPALRTWSSVGRWVPQSNMAETMRAAVEAWSAEKPRPELGGGLSCCVVPEGCKGIGRVSGKLLCKVRIHIPGIDGVKGHGVVEDTGRVSGGEVGRDCHWIRDMECELRGPSLGRDLVGRGGGVGGARGGDGWDRGGRAPGGGREGLGRKALVIRVPKDSKLLGGGPISRGILPSVIGVLCHGHSRKAQ
ncbi:hypothetical protein B0F90DRAFT_1669687 [Multifurca ochricompacta]|uniref:Uncharacterized protein n=1 Tax=Multifurca ochricompacta TaxID=376703 RepID=A0AAD4QLI3_9AGAM|nr:hypothetical protein B0F90DRAFT_1669687 [Multifurca ochricompacta]